jgi:hypothetical protein
MRRKRNLKNPMKQFYKANQKTIFTVAILAGVGFLIYKNLDKIKQAVSGLADFNAYPNFGAYTPSLPAYGPGYSDYQLNDYSGHGILGSPTGAAGDVSEAFLSDYSDVGSFPDTESQIPRPVGMSWSGTCQ